MLRHVRFGRTGLEVSELCLGTWMFGTELAEGSEAVDADGAASILNAAWETGLNFFDTANVYGGGRSEEYIGAWLEDKDRENFVVASKVAYATRGRQPLTLSRKGVFAEVEGSLDRLGSDYVDVCYIHEWSYSTPIEETLGALNDLVRAGKIHYIGVSNFATWQLVLADRICRENGWAPVSVIQPRFNAVDNLPYTCDPYEMPLPDLFDACRYFDIAVCAFSPLAEGFLTGKYGRDETGETTAPENSRGKLRDSFGPHPERWWKVLSEVEAVAEELDATPAQVAIRWIMDTPDVTSIPIIGAKSASQLNETLEASSLSLSEEQLQRITDAGAMPGLAPHAYTFT